MTAVARPAPRGSGWAVVAAKEFADQILSVRFLVLLIVVGVAAAVPLYIAAERIRSLASDVSGAQAVFIALFIIGPTDRSIFGISISVASFVGLAAPLLGIAFSFDAINGERAQGTLPRLVAQPIHRDAIINGKVMAALATISLVVVSVLMIIAGVGIFRLGITPSAGELLRLLAWLAVTILYIGLWLAFGILLSVVFRRAATAALVGFGVWLLIALFGQFIVNLVLAVIAPLDSAAPIGDQLGALQIQAFVHRLLPSTLYQEASIVLLNPTVTSTNAPSTLGQLDQVQQQIPTLLSLQQSLLLVWPQVVALLAMAVACFAYAYVRFMREEVRA